MVDFTGSDLQVCLSKNLTCCTKKMEERYQVAARRDVQNLLQITSSSLKFLISRNVAAFQETVESLVRQAENHTHAVLLHTYRDLASPAAAPVGEFFTDVGLFVLGSELSLEEASQRFFDALFPLVYERLVEPDLSRLSLPYTECVRASCRDLGPYGGAPGRLAALISRASLPGRVFLQALHLGVEVINTTDHIQLSRECRRGLLRMSYCPHCQGLTASKPCMGYCLNVVRGCLASLAEVDAHWREFVRSLETLSTRMHGAQDLEQVLLEVPGLVRDAVAHAQRNAPRLSSQVRRVCGHPVRQQPEQVSSGQHSSAGRDSIPLKAAVRNADDTLSNRRKSVRRVCGHPVRQQPEQVSSGQHSSAGRDSIPLKAAVRNADDTLSNRRKEFLSSLRLHRAFYGGLADQLCVSDLASGDGTACWNGAGVASYTLRVVGNGIKAQAENPEVKVKEADPVISQVIDKLKHINQLLQGKSIPKLGTLDQIETGSGEGYSGDCDDEDGCWGSGNGAAERRRIETILTPENTNNHRYHHPQSKGFDQMNSGTRGTQPVPLALVWICAFALLSG
ncbi:glypican-5a [Sinocyclocheilus rhinocerous]|uniref:glypican-5a n=1 Tax=Sinocyclocheilus rhinocerous TaxID=307959 RepID=UPI0007B9E097|nr:PREDICTED: glypican-5-like [Sinocyclocheilus rhinocerous]